MHRRRVVLVLAVLTVLTCLLTGAAPVFASEPEVLAVDKGAPVGVILEVANGRVYTAIRQAQILADVRPQDLDAIIEDLLTKADRVVAWAVKLLDGRVEVEFSIVWVLIGDRLVPVDPMKVAGG